MVRLSVPIFDTSVVVGIYEKETRIERGKSEKAVRVLLLYHVIIRYKKRHDPDSWDIRNIQSLAYDTWHVSIHPLLYHFVWESFIRQAYYQSSLSYWLEWRVLNLNRLILRPAGVFHHNAKWIARSSWVLGSVVMKFSNVILLIQWMLALLDHPSLLGIWWHAISWVIDILHKYIMYMKYQIYEIFGHIDVKPYSGIRFILAISDYLCVNRKQASIVSQGRHIFIRIRWLNTKCA